MNDQMENIQTELLAELKKNNDVNREIVKVLTVGAEPESWGKEDYYQFYSKIAFKIFGLIFAGALVFVPSYIDGISESNRSLILGAGLSLIPSIVLNGSDPQKSKSKAQQKK